MGCVWPAPTERGNLLSNLYLLALGGVGLVLLALVVDAVISVSRQPNWTVPHHHLMLVDKAERRTNPLPVVGTDSREKPTDSELARLTA